MSQAPAAGKVPQSTKLIYGLGSVAYGAKTQLLGLLLLFYNQLVGLPAAAVSLALSISIVIDAVWDPLVGQWSDNLRSRWGRRHPLMYASAIPFAVCWVLLWRPPVGWSDQALFGYLLVLVVASRMLISLYEVPSSALAPELAPAYHERTSLLSYRYLFGTLGGAGASILAFAVFLKGTPDQPMGQLNIEGYWPYALTVAAIMVVSILGSTAGTHDRIPTLHQPPARKATLADMVREVSATLANRNFLVIVLSGTFAGMAGGLSNGLGIYFSTYFWELPSSNLLILVLGGLVASPVAAIIAPLLSKRFGKKQACINLFFAGLLVSVLPVGLRLLGLMPPNGEPLLVGVLLLDRIVSGMLGIAGYIIVASMIADIVEESQIKTGRRSEGLLMSADTLLQKVVGGIAAILPGVMLAVIGFPDHAKPGAVDPAVLRNLALLYLPATAALSVAAIGSLYLYRIDRDAHERNLETIAEGAAKAELLAEALDQAPESITTITRPA
jgi:Na+/melibiose symporter-like transporter